MKGFQPDNSPDHRTPLKLSGNYVKQDISDIILELCSTPMSREDLALRLGIESQYYLGRKYLKPLLDSGRLKMTLPEAPQSKFQKFYTA